MNVVWVVSGGDVVVVAALSLVWGVVWMPRAWAAGVEERKAKGAVVVVVVSVLLEVSVAEVVELRVSRFGSVEEEEEDGGLRRDFRRAIWASLRAFSAIRAAWRVRVSRSLRRRV